MKLQRQQRYQGIGVCAGQFNEEGMMDLSKYIDLCEEQCGFSRDAQNPDSKGWRDILEFLCEDAGCKAALVARFKKRIEEDAEEREELEPDDDRYVGPFPACKTWDDLRDIARAGAGLQYLNKKGES